MSKRASPDTDAGKCPRCGGEADNGHDREFPPNPYLCTKCDPPDYAKRTQQEQEGFGLTPLRSNDMATKQTKKLFMYRSVEHGYEGISATNLPKGIPHEYILLGVCESAVFEMQSDKDQVMAAVASLESAKRHEMAESQQRLNRLDEKIQSLLALTHEPA